MKSLILVIACFAPLFSYASVPPKATAKGAIESLVAKDIDSILSETYDEGEGTASVKKASCRIVKTTVKGHTAYCSVDILVQPDRNSRYKNIVSCKSMAYSIPKNLQSVDLFSGWQKCIEQVNDTTEF